MEKIKSSTKPIVGITCDYKTLDGYNWYATPEFYVHAVLRAVDAIPVLIPAVGKELDFAGLVSRLDGVLVTGSRSNIHPRNYDVEPTPAHEPFDERRDATTLPLIRTVIEMQKPLLCICRGHQEANVALGGSINTAIQEMDGIMDHRAPVSNDQNERFAIRQEIHLTPQGKLEKLVGERFRTVKVNSLHGQAINRLASGLTVEARADDGIIEATSIDALEFGLTLQCHPEYFATENDFSKAIFSAFRRALG